MENAYKTICTFQKYVLQMNTLEKVQSLVHGGKYGVHKMNIRRMYTFVGGIWQILYTDFSAEIGRGGYHRPTQNVHEIWQEWG